MTGLPLQDVRILDLTQAWAGSYALQILGDLGAEVIKVESRSRPDPWRGGFGASRGLPCYPLDGPGERPYNRSYLANSVNRNKLGITLDLSSSDGKRLFLDLAQTADVVTENFTPRVLGNLGIGYDVLSNIKPGIILLSMPAFGLSGQYRDFPGIGGTIEPMSSNAWLLGELAGKPQVSGVMYPDAVAGLNGAAAVLSALYNRTKTGNGCHMEVSQHESMIAMLGGFFDSEDLESLDRQGNRDCVLAPHGIFRCRGEDQWVAVAIRNATDWDALAACLGDARLASSELRDTARRRAAEDEIERIIGEWTATRSSFAAEAELLSHGIPAARVRSIADVVNCPQLNVTGYLQLVEQPEGIPPAPMPGIIARLSKTPGAVRMSPARHGEHSRDVLSRLLGMGDAELDDLTDRGIIGSGPPPEVAVDAAQPSQNS
jgi:crotonobetainyl-CoA:carnitine CoA-transferase CaiB-like acyl-CoA transferase